MMKHPTYSFSGLNFCGTLLQIKKNKNSSKIREIKKFAEIKCHMLG